MLQERISMQLEREVTHAHTHMCLHTHTCVCTHTPVLAHIRLCFYCSKSTALPSLGVSAFSLEFLSVCLITEEEMREREREGEREVEGGRREGKRE